jgi:hypothetical protein
MTSSEGSLLDSVPPDEQARLRAKAADAVAQKDRNGIAQVLSEALAGLLLAGAFDELSEAEIQATVDGVVAELGVFRSRPRH